MEQMLKRFKFFLPTKSWKNHLKKLHTYGSWDVFFSAAPTAQNSPELHFRFINSFIQASLLRSLAYSNAPSGWSLIKARTFFYSNIFYYRKMIRNYVYGQNKITILTFLFAYGNASSGWSLIKVKARHFSGKTFKKVYCHVVVRGQCVFLSAKCSSQSQ